MDGSGSLCCIIVLASPVTQPSQEKSTVASYCQGSHSSRATYWPQESLIGTTVFRNLLAKRPFDCFQREANQDRFDLSVVRWKLM